MFLNFVPTGITNDELHFILNAKSVYYTFTDISGKWNPLSLSTIPNEASSELTFLILAPLVGPLPINLFTARLPFVLFNLVSILLIYLISNKIFNPKISFYITLVTLLNPWNIFVSRTSFDAPIALFFYLLTFYLLIKLKKWYLLIAVVPALFAFYTYIGTKVIFLPFMLICTIYSYWYISSKKYFWPYLSFILSCTAIFVFFIYSIKHQPIGNRLTELTDPNSQQIINQVDIERNQTIDTPIKSLFSNRYTYYFFKFSQKYLNSFSPNVLFLNGDPTYLVSLWKHGYFYIIDFALIILGLCYLYNRSKSTFYLFVALLLISPLPEAVRVDIIPAYAFHSVLQFPLLSILTGLGIVALIKISKYYIPVISLIYLISFVNFINTYLFQYPLYQPEGFNFSRQIVSSYLMRLPINTSAYVITSEPESLFRNYLFYSNSYQKNQTATIQQQYSTNNRQDFSINNLHFAKSFNNLSPNDTVISAVEISPSQYTNQPKRTIYRLASNTQLYEIYNDQVCQNQFSDTRYFPYFSELNVAILPTNQFCNLYIK